MRAMWAVVRAYRATAAERARHARARVRARRHVLASAALVLAGLAGALAGGWLVGRWCLGLVLIAESCGALYYGLFRDDAAPVPRVFEHTVADVLEAERRRP